MTTPRFMVMKAPGFYDGRHLVPPGTEIAWESKVKPSKTFRPMNREAAVLLGDKAVKAWDDEHGPPPMQPVTKK